MFRKTKELRVFHDILDSVSTNSMHLRYVSNMQAYRNTQLKLPSKLGRLPRLIGVSPAIDLICSGDSVAPTRAVALGLAFDAVPADRLVDEGVRLIEALSASGAWERDRVRRRQPVGLSEDGSARWSGRRGAERS